MKKLCLSMFAIASFRLFAATPLPTQYIAPVTNMAWEAAVTNAPYGTGTGIVFKVKSRVLDGRTYYNFHTTLEGRNYMTWNKWVHFSAPNGSALAFGANFEYRRSVLSPGAPARRYLYPAYFLYNYNDSSSGEWIVNDKATITVNVGQSALSDALLTQNGLDSGLNETQTKVLYDGVYYDFSAKYVQCVHTDWVYTVTFDANGGSGGPMGIFTFTNSAALPACAYTMAGHSFKGWCPNADGSGTTYADESDIGEDLALYATWTANTYTVTMRTNRDAVDRWPNLVVDMDDGTTAQVTYGQRYGLPVPAAAGYAFSGWYDPEADAMVDTSQPVGITSDRAFWAQWTANSYTVTLDPQGGTDGTSSVLATYDSAMPDMEIPVRTGYTFGGYYTSTDGGGVQYYDASGASARAWDKTAATTLYAKWTANTYTVTMRTNRDAVDRWPNLVVDMDDGTTAQVAYGQRYYLPVPTAAGYSFSGWYDPEADAMVDTSQPVGITGDRDFWAQWTANSYAVTLDRQGGTGGSSSVSATYGLAMPPVAMPSRTGYTFGGYYTAPGGGSVQYYDASGASARAWDMTDATTLYAKWTANTYTVTLDPQGGTGGSSSVSATYTSAMPDIEIPVRTGYTFGGYYTSANGGGTQYYDASGASAHNWDKASATTIYAKWTANTYTVTMRTNWDAVDRWPNLVVDMDDGTTAQVTYGQRYGLPVPAAAGYAFSGWYDPEADAMVDTSQPVGITGDRDFWAQWTANSYTVTLNQQGGADGAPSVSATYGLAMPPVAMPSRTGYAFGGYYTSTDGGGVQYYDASGASARAWDKTAATTLYAKWTANSYTVTFDPQGGTGGSSSVSATYTSAMPDIEIPVRAGYKFGGYYAAADGVGTQYYTAYGASAHNWDKASATTLYAKWTANAYAVALDRQGGTGGSSSVSAAYDSAMPPMAMPSRTGYTFGGYYTAVNGGGVQYYTESGASARAWDMTDATTLYAKWTANSYTVTLDPQGGTGGTSSTNAVYGSEMPGIEVPSREGYAFGGYYTSANGGGTQYYDASGASAHNWDKASATTLYAKWTANTYTVTMRTNRDATDRWPNLVVDMDDGTTAQVTYGQRYYLPVPTAAGYAFSGWYDPEANAMVDTSQPVGITSDRAFWAQWTAKSYTVTLNQQGGTGGSSSVSATYGLEMPPVAMPSRTGYAFGGYYTSTDGGGVQYYDASGASARAWDKTAATTLYAQWKADTAVITFDKNGGAGGSDGVTATYGSDLPAIAAPSRTGYRFLGYWYSNVVSGVSRKYYDENGGSLYEWDLLLDEATFYAGWEAKKYTINFANMGATDGLSSVDLTYGEKPNGLSKVPSYNAGYSFGGYWTGDYGTGVRYWDNLGRWVGGDVWTNIDVDVVYAYARPKRMTVAFDPNGGSCDTEDKEVEYGNVYGDLPTPSREKHSFLGWFTAKSGGTGITKDSEVERDENHTLYAHWRDNTVGIRFDANGGMVDGASVTNVVGYYEIGKAYGDFPMPTNSIESLFFAGWWTSTNPVDRVQVFETNLVDAATTNLYARWKSVVEAVPCTLTFKRPNGAKFSETNAVVGAEFGSYFPKPGPTDGDKTVFGWYIGKTRVHETDIIESNTTLTAKWTLGAFNEAWNCRDIVFETPNNTNAEGWKMDVDNSARSGKISSTMAYYDEARSYLKMTPVRSGSFSIDLKVSCRPDEEFAYMYLEQGGDSGSQILLDKTAGNMSSFLTTSMSHLEFGDYVSLLYYQSGDAHDDYDLDTEDCAWAKNLKWTPDREPTPVDDWTSFSAVTAEVPKAVWSTGGAQPWATAEGMEIAAAGAISNGRTSWLKLETPAAKGVLSFKWKTSCEAGYVDTNGVYQACDRLEFVVDGNESGKTSIEGIVDWSQVAWTNDVEEARSFLWRYVKDGDVADGDDAALVKDVVWTPLAEETVVEYEYEEGGEVKHGSVAVPNSWVDEYDLKTVSGKDDYLSALMSPSGKTGYGGVPLSYWADYVAGTVPTNPASVFRVTGFSVVDGVTVITWDPDRDDRQYTVWGKTNLTDAAWHTPTNSASRFFRVEVNLPKQ